MTKIKKKKIMNKDQIYEEEKRKIIAKDLTPEEYEKEIKLLCKRINY
jgi:hypothetical protein